MPTRPCVLPPFVNLIGVGAKSIRGVGHFWRAGIMAKKWLAEPCFGRNAQSVLAKKRKIFPHCPARAYFAGLPVGAGKVSVFGRRPGLRALGVKKAAGACNARRYSDSVGFCLGQSLHARGMQSR